MISVDEINRLHAENKRLNDIIDSYQPRLEELKELKADYAELKAENERLKEEIKEVKKYQYQQEYLDKEIAELKAENERLYEEKNCLHKIIDRLLDNAGYSKDIASAEDFEDVYENMQS